MLRSDVRTDARRPCRSVLGAVAAALRRSCRSGRGRAAGWRGGGGRLGTGCSSGTTCGGARRSGRWPTRGSRWQRSPSSLTACGSPRWSRRWPGVGQSRWPGRPRRWTGSAVAGSPWVWVWAATRFGGELSRTGEEIEGRRRGQMLDQSLDILTAAWSGQPVHHHGPHHTVDGIQFLPRPVQRPGVPVWAAGLAGNVKSLRRAARSASPPS